MGFESRLVLSSSHHSAFNLQICMCEQIPEFFARVPNLCQDHCDSHHSPPVVEVPWPGERPTRPEIPVSERALFTPLFVMGCLSTLSGTTSSVNFRISSVMGRRSRIASLLSCLSTFSVSGVVSVINIFSPAESGAPRWRSFVFAQTEP